MRLHRLAIAAFGAALGATAGLQTRFGPAFAVIDGGGNGQFAFEALLGVAYSGR
jgi:hypothetical protein